MPEELMQDSTIDESIPMAEAVSESPFAPSPEPPRKIAGMFDNEQQVAQTLEAMAQQLNQREAELQRFIAKEQEAVQQDATRQGWQQFHEHREFQMKRAQDLMAQGKTNEAWDLMYGVIKGPIVAEAQNLVRQELQQVLGPVQSKREFLSAPDLAHLHQFADVAVELESQGVPRPHVVTVMDALFRHGATAAAQRFQRQRPAYTEDADSGYLTGNPQDEARLTNGIRNRWERVLGMRK